MTPPPPFRFKESLDSLRANLSTAIVGETLQFIGGKKEVVG